MGEISMENNNIQSNIQFNIEEIDEINQDS